MDAGGGRDDVLLCVFAVACDGVDGVERGELDLGVLLDVCVDDDGAFLSFRWPALKAGVVRVLTRASFSI